MFHLTTTALIGVQAVPIAVETDISFGLGNFNVVGMPDTAVKEARDRIRAAIKNSGFPFPRTRVTVNLAPANIRKQGTSFDVPIALSLLLAEGVISSDALEKTVVVGELALDGSLRPVQGVLATALFAKKEGYTTLIVPEKNTNEATAIPGLLVYPVSNLQSLVQHLTKTTIISPHTLSEPPKGAANYAVDFAHVKGQHHAKRGLEIAAAGGHNVLLKGPPGTGKTLLAKAFPSILPNLEHEEALEVSAIASVAGILPAGKGLLYERPFRAPHHSSTPTSLIGGGSWPRPGEVSLAHRGVLFLDELPEFSRHTLEHLRQPLEDGEVQISRTAASVTFPACFTLIATMNPCPCGYSSDPKRACICSAKQIHGYQRRISGPLLDRFDLVIEVPNIDPRTLVEKSSAETSITIRKRVNSARDIQRRRFSDHAFFTNSEISTSYLEEWCEMNREAKDLLESSLKNHHLSARGYTRVQKIARSIADLAGADKIETEHVAEALQYRGQESLPAQ